jgi:hypothetical protein
MTQAEREIRRKVRIRKHAERSGNVARRAAVRHQSNLDKQGVSSTGDRNIMYLNVRRICDASGIKAGPYGRRVRVSLGSVAHAT